MSEFLQDVEAGDPLPASARLWNALIASARAHLSKQYGTGGDLKGNLRRMTVPALVKNGTGGAIDAFQVMGLGTTIGIDPSSYLSEFKQGPVLVGATPDVDDHFGRWCVALEPIASNSLGWCAVGGVVPVQVNIGSASHKFCDVYDASAAKLKSDWHGAGRILYQAGTSGDQWCAVLIGSVTYRFGKVKGQATAAVASADGTYTIDTIKVMRGATPASPLTVQNTFADDIDDNGVVTASWNEEQQQWETDDVTCPA